MTFPKSTPLFPGSGGKIRDQVLAILVQEFPLSIKEIYFRIRRSGYEITYQAVHKAIKQLMEEKVLQKEGKDFRIAKDWIVQAKEYIQMVESTFSDLPSPKNVIDHLPKETKIHFTKYSELCVFVAKLLVEYQKRKKTILPHYVILWHIWWPLKFEFSMWTLFYQMDGQSPENRTVIAENTRFDKMIGKYYRLANPSDKMIIGIYPKEKIEEDRIVRGDLIIQVNYSENTRKEIEEIFSGIESLTDLFQLYFIQAKPDGPFDIDVTISENPGMARLFKEKVKSYFGEK